MFDQKWGRKSRDTVPWRNVLKYRPQRVCVLIFSTFIFFTIELTHYVLDSLIKNRFSEGNNLARSFELEVRQFLTLRCARHKFERCTILINDMLTCTLYCVSSMLTCTLYSVQWVYSMSCLLTFTVHCKCSYGVQYVWFADLTLVCYAEMYIVQCVQCTLYSRPGMMTYIHCMYSTVCLVCWHIHYTVCTVCLVCWHVH